LRVWCFQITRIGSKLCNKPQQVGHRYYESVSLNPRQDRNPRQSQCSQAYHPCKRNFSLGLRQDAADLDEDEERFLETWEAIFFSFDI
jgi:hypothetical protein